MYYYFQAEDRYFLLFEALNNEYGTVVRWWCSQGGGKWGAVKVTYPRIMKGLSV